MNNYQIEKQKSSNQQTIKQSAITDKIKLETSNNNYLIDTFSNYPIAQLSN